MTEYKGIELEEIETVEEYFEVFGEDQEALQYLLKMFLEQVFDMQEFLQSEGYTGEDFLDWQKEKQERSYH
tara:strand:- start:285 stop:497 length:213 start_codon:yes stop_codon:yes gene_type:complete